MTGASQLDLALERAREATRVAARIQALAAIIETMHGIRPAPVPEECVVGEDGIPCALDWFYTNYWDHTAVHSRQNTLVGRERLDHSRDPLVFLDENQCVFSWATTRGQPDPPVFGRLND